MAGIDILAHEEVAVAHSFNWAAYVISFAVLLTVFVLIGIGMSAGFADRKQILVGAIAGTILGGVFGLMFGFALETPTEYETHYKVTISDEVHMNDFLERYEILDQEGKIYTVRER